jgi:hypothetical protein
MMKKEVSINKIGKDAEEQCISFTGEIAKKTAAIIVRELGLVNFDE